MELTGAATFVDPQLLSNAAYGSEYEQKVVGRSDIGDLTGALSLIEEKVGKETGNTQFLEADVW